MLAGAYARPGWKHLGFETQEEYYKFLEKTFNISGLTGIRPVNNLDYLTSTANPNNKVRILKCLQNFVICFKFFVM